MMASLNIQYSSGPTCTICIVVETKLPMGHIRTGMYSVNH